MDWGKKNRLSRLIKSDGHCFYLPIDHGYFLGPTRNLEKPNETIAPLTPYADALFVTRGILRSCIDAEESLPIILRVSGGSSIVGGPLENESITTSIEEILRLNVSAVGVSVFIGSKYEKQTVMNLANLVNECERYGIPVMAVTAVGKELEKRDARYLGLCARIFAEMGASVVKTYWCEDFHKVTESCPVPVVIAGGPKVDTAREVFEFVHDGIQRGAIGVNLGRNIWQHEYPVAMMRALHSIIHEGADVDGAQALFESVQKESA
jgi:3-hydroxy-5-phosphonooxypentane-2,4-dione thiolase